MQNSKSKSTKGAGPAFPSETWPRRRLSALRRQPAQGGQSKSDMAPQLSGLDVSPICQVVTLKRSCDLGAALALGALTARAPPVRLRLWDPFREPSARGGARRGGRLAQGAPAAAVPHTSGSAAGVPLWVCGPRGPLGGPAAIRIKHRAWGSRDAGEREGPSSLVGAMLQNQARGTSGSPSLRPYGSNDPD
jgi:hypothetical protein